MLNLVKNKKKIANKEGSVLQTDDIFQLSFQYHFLETYRLMSKSIMYLEKKSTFLDTYYTYDMKVDQFYIKDIS